MSTFGQVAKSTGTNKHGIVVLGHTMRFCIQGVARVTQQVHDADMHYIYLPKPEISSSSSRRAAMSTEGIGADKGRSFLLRSLTRCR